MANLIKLKTYSDKRWSLTPIEKVLPFDIKRVYYMYDVHAGIERWWHRHKKTIQAIICLEGECIISINNKWKKQKFILDKPDKCLILSPEDRHTLSFSEKAIALVLASEHFDADDYIAESY